MSNKCATGVTQPAADPDTTPGGDPVTYSTWATNFGFQWQGTESQYVASLYYVTATLLTVGYGDIHAVNVPERVYAIILMVISALVFGAIIGEVRMIIESQGLLQKDVSEKTTRFKEYMAERNLSTDLRIEALVSTS